VSEDASTEDIKKAFRSLAREVHPDVAGEEPEVAERFKRIREAYEVLVDPTARRRYDRRRQGYSRPPPGRFGFRPGGFSARQANTSHTQSRSDLDLEDIFADHGGIIDFGFGAQKPKDTKHRAPPKKELGRDVVLTVDLDQTLADQGGSIRLDYSRIVRGDDGKTLVRVDDVHVLHVSPHTAHGDTIRIPRMGDAGPNGGLYGDLVCDVRVEGSARSPRDGGPPPRSESARRDAPPRSEGTEELVVPITVAECLLGGRIEVETPQGRVRVNVPPCTGGGARLRLRGKGHDDASGEPVDLVVRLRVVPPPLVDDESRELIERFAELNPYDPRRGDG